MAVDCRSWPPLLTSEAALRTLNKSILLCYYTVLPSTRMVLGPQALLRDQFTSSVYTSRASGNPGSPQKPSWDRWQESKGKQLLHWCLIPTPINWYYELQESSLRRRSIRGTQIFACIVVQFRILYRHVMSSLGFWSAGEFVSCLAFAHFCPKSPFLTTTLNKLSHLESSVLNR